MSPPYLVPKPNGAPRLIDDLSRFNKFVSHGPKVKHMNIFKLSSKFSNNTFFTKLDLRNGCFHIPIYPPHRTYFGFSFERQMKLYEIWIEGGLFILHHLKAVVMYYTPGHKCPGCVVHNYSQFYEKI